MYKDLYISVCAQPLFCSLSLLFGDVLVPVAIAVVICLSSLQKQKQQQQQLYTDQ